MNDNDIELFILTNEPVFTLGGKEYSVCCPEAGSFATWDSDGNTQDYPSFDALLDEWFVGGKPFREVAPTLMKDSSYSSL